MPSVLIHCCCAHCAAYQIDYWRSKGFETQGLWYNPNIHPEEDYVARREALKTLAAAKDFPLTVSEVYDSEKFFALVKGHETDRCRHCFELRLGQTAEIARQKGLTGFTTTLLISPQQKHELIIEIGNKVARELSVEFFYADLRKKFTNSRIMTKPMGLYRQQYCGCVYSREERYADEQSHLKKE